MRRTIPVAAATAGGLGLLLSFHTSPTKVKLVSPPSAAPSATAPPPTARTAPGGSSTTTAAPGGTRTVDGPLIETPYGPVQVRVTFSGSRITDIQALQLPKDRSRSRSISNYAGPELRQEVLQAQSANIDLVSGASYTSEGYAQSLQAVLDGTGR